MDAFGTMIDKLLCKPGPVHKDRLGKAANGGVFSKQGVQVEMEPLQLLGKSQSKLGVVSLENISNVPGSSLLDQNPLLVDVMMSNCCVLFTIKATFCWLLRCLSQHTSIILINGVHQNTMHHKMRNTLETSK